MAFSRIFTLRTVAISCFFVVFVFFRDFRVFFVFFRECDNAL